MFLVKSKGFYTERVHLLVKKIKMHFMARIRSFLTLGLEKNQLYG